MKTYIGSRIIEAFILLLASIVFSFFIFRILPGDPTLAISGDPRLPTETRESLRNMFGLDKPIYEQFLIFLINTLKGNLGISFQYKVPVVRLLTERLLNTMILLIPATTLSIILGVILGILAARFRGGLLDTIVTSVATILWSTPSFWGGILMIYLFAVTLHIFPTGGFISYRASYIDVGDLLYHLLLPMLTYGIIYSGQYALVVRSSLSEVLSEDFILLSKAKGYSDSQVIRKHALKNAMLPLVTQIGLNLGHLFLGSISIETVFTWPGVGQLIYNAVYYNDYALLQGIFLFFSVVTILLTVIIDILYTYLDPRVRLK